MSEKKPKAKPKAKPKRKKKVIEEVAASVDINIGVLESDPNGNEWFFLSDTNNPDYNIGLELGCVVQAIEEYFEEKEKAEMEAAKKGKKVEVVDNSKSAHDCGIV